MEQPDRLALRYEIARKAIHLSSLSIAIIYYNISRELALLLLAPIFAGFLLVDLLKNSFKPVAVWYHKTFDAMLRTHEIQKVKTHLNGATCITLSALILVIFFPKIIVIASFSMVAVSDTLAAIVGKAFGRHRFGQKSVEGSIAFFLSALAIVTIVPGINPFIGIIMAATATLTEAFVVRVAGFRIDDNLTIPIVSALVGTLSYILLMPEQFVTLSNFR